MTVKIGYAESGSAEEVASSLKEQLTSEEPAEIVIFFASPTMIQPCLPKLCRRRFRALSHSDAQQRRGEIISGHMLRGGVVAMSLLEAIDIPTGIRKDLDTLQRGSSPIRALIDFHCILRTFELEAKGRKDAYGAVFADIPTIGFSTYGEEYLGHINQTSTILALK